MINAVSQVRSQSAKLSPLKMTILPALWSYIGAVAVEIDEVISGGWYRVRSGVATRAHNLLELQGHGSQRSYLEGSIDDRDDADDEYWLIRDAVDAVDVCLDCMQSSTLQCVQSLVSISRLILTLPHADDALLVYPK